MFTIKKAVIIYESIHHKNTEKVINYVADKLQVKIVKLKDVGNINLKDFDLIILASGIYYNQFYKGIDKWIENQNFQNKEVGVIYTCGLKYMDYAKDISKKVIENGGKYIGSSWCRGYDTYGFLSIIGGIAKKHPNNQDLEKIKKQIEEWL